MSGTIVVSGVIVLSGVTVMSSVPEEKSSKFLTELALFACPMGRMAWLTWRGLIGQDSFARAHGFWLMGSDSLARPHRLRLMPPDSWPRIHWLGFMGFD